MAKQYKVATVIGRFEPIHNGHIHLLRHAASIAERVIVLVGSAFRSRSPENPFTFVERSEMIRAAFIRDIGAEITFSVQPIPDTIYDDNAWLGNAQAAVAKAFSELGVLPDAKCALVGHKKDSTSYYLDCFPQWELVEVANRGGLSATEIRELYLAADGLGEGARMNIASSVPKSTLDFLSAFAVRAAYKNLVAYAEHVKSYKAQFAGLKYKPTFITTDAVVVQSGHVLLVTRKAQPGAGLLALPGGFLGEDELIVDGMVRELREETRIDLVPKIIKGSIVASHVFDHPRRSLRGRTVTHAFHVQLAGGPLTKIRAGSDAKRAQWVPLGQIASLREDLYEDHYDIMHHFGILP